jgi:hypothetical protein
MEDGGAVGEELEVDCGLMWAGPRPAGKITLWQVGDLPHLSRDTLKEPRGKAMRRLPPTRLQDVLHRVKLWFRRKPKSPDDPYAYVTAPKKPRLPHLSSAAVAELSEK